MKYYQILNLIREPFSNSPEPEFFYQSPQHVKCLQNLELAIRLRRGLNVVIGNVGTGKTTLCRRLIDKFDDDKNINTHLLLDPCFGNSIEFLFAVGRMFGLEEKTAGSATEWQLKEEIKNYLLEQGAGKENIVVLIIDEGQKIPDFCLEILREFLNYETSEHKLLQIVIFAQDEFRKTLDERSNFTDRINFLYDLGPLNFGDTRSMIQYRMKKASKTGENPLHFTCPAMWAIYSATGGYPRKIVTLCHQIILAVIVQNRTGINWFLVRASVHRKDSGRKKSISWVKAAVLSGLSVIVLVMGLGIDDVKRYIHLLTNEQSESFDVTKVSEQSAVSGKNIKSTPVDSLKNLPSGQPVIAAEANASTDTGAEIPPDPASETINTPEYPPTLGRLSVEKGWVVSKMIAAVYGFYNNKNRVLVESANPGIKNLNRVTAGDVISFPLISAESQPSPSMYWVQIGKKDELESAHTLLRQYSDRLPPMQILPYWNNHDGLKFSILIRGGFLDERSAREAIDKLPALIAVDSEIVSKWGDDTVFFANLEMADS